MSWATYSDVQSRIPGRTIDATTKPSSTEVSAWVDEGEAEIYATLQAAGIDPTACAGAVALKILRSWVCDYAEGHARMAYASAGGDGQNDDGKDILERFYKRLDDILANPSRYGAMLSAGTSPTDTLRVRGSTPSTDALFSMDMEL